VIVRFLRKLFRNEGEAGEGEPEPMHGPGERTGQGEGAAVHEGGGAAPLDVEGDPRGGLQDEEYRTADPREVVESDGTVMSGPAGAPMEDTSPAERREQDR
jgi:hypothetical protein